MLEVRSPDRTGFGIVGDWLGADDVNFELSTGKHLKISSINDEPISKSELCSSPPPVDMKVGKEGAYGTVDSDNDF